MPFSRRSESVLSKRPSFILWTPLALAACTSRPDPTRVRAQALTTCLQSDNPIQCENRQDGTSDWKLTAPAPGRTLEGYSSATSVDRTEQSIDLHISAPVNNTSVKLEVFRMGWYSGRGARVVYTVPSFTAQHEDDCPQDSSTGLVECSWGKSTVQLPLAQFSSPWQDGLPVSGYYLVRLTTPPPPSNPTLQNYILFVVRDDTRSATFLMNSAMTTYQAYNTWGNNSLYTQFPDGRYHTQVSFDRPMVYGQGLGDFIDIYLDAYLDPNNPYFRWPGGYEYPMVRFVERQGYDVKYATDIDLHAKPNLLGNVTAFLSVGHNEYWSKDMHHNLEAARDRSSPQNPTNIAFFAGNSVYWIINILPNTAQTVQNRIIETHKDPFPTQTSPVWLWQLCPQVQSGYPNPVQTCSAEEGSEQRLVGSITTDGATDRGDVVFSANDFTSSELAPIFRDTALNATSRLAGMIGYEAQTVKADKFPVPKSQTVFGHSVFRSRPIGLNPMSLPTDMSLYRGDNGAKVVSTGSPDWSLGLDIYTENFPSSVYLRDHPAIPQMTRNILEQAGGLPHVPPQPQIGPGYTVSISSTQDPNIFQVSWSAPAGRSAQTCSDKPWCDFVVLHDTSESDDVGVLVDYFKHYTSEHLNPFLVDASTLPAKHTYQAEYITVDRVWASDYRDNLRTIWRAAKSSTTIVR